MPNKPGPKFSISAETSYQIRHEYEAGASTTDLAQKYGFKPDTIRSAIKRAGGRIRSYSDTNQLRSPLYGVDLQELVSLYEAEGSHAAMKKYRCSQPTVLDAVRRAGGNVRPPGHNVKSGTGSVDGNGYRVITVSKNWPFWKEMGRKHSSPTSIYVAEHRKIMADLLGRSLLPSESVHHINGDKLDNRPENLQLRASPHGKNICYACLDCGSRRIAPTELQ